MEARLEPIRAQRICRHSDWHSSQPTVRRAAVHPADAARRSPGAQPESAYVLKSCSAGRVEPDTANSEPSVGRGLPRGKPRSHRRAPPRANLGSPAVEPIPSANRCSSDAGGGEDQHGLQSRRSLELEFRYQPGCSHSSTVPSRPTHSGTELSVDVQRHGAA